MVGLAGEAAQAEEPKAGKLEREGHLGIDVRADDGDTLRIIAAGHTQHRREEIENGVGANTRRRGHQSGARRSRNARGDTDVRRR
jgi:hypothetical protein